MLTDPNFYDPDTCEFKGRATLENYGFEFRVFANVFPEIDSSVQGAVWEIDKKTLKQFDHAEGYPNLYTRKLLPVILSNGEEDEAIVYLMTPSSRKYMNLERPSRGYINTLYIGYRHSKIPTKQIKDALERAPDPPNQKIRTFRR